ncbi:XRE family transcriptional regulator [Streptomyces sp. CB01881]|nr:XRE family transcriptional regulator [Streptomyces sp. CB01881]
MTGGIVAVSQARTGLGMPRVAALRCAGSRRLLPWKQALLTIRRIAVMKTIAQQGSKIRTLAGNSLSGGNRGQVDLLTTIRADLARPQARKETMPPRPNPTLRQRRLGTELRRMREQAGLGGTQLARTLGMSPAQVTQMETGKIGISADRLRTIAAACKCANQPLVDALAGLAATRGKGWWEEYRGVLPTDFLEVAEMEAHSHELYTWATTYIPGLQQTSAYASAVFARITPPLPRHDIDVRTAFRVQRQHVVRSGKTPYVSFIHEAALRMQFGGPKVLADQLGSLIEDSAQPEISVRVVPFDMDTFPGAGENIMFAEGPVPELATLQMDTAQGVLFFDSPADLASHRTTFARLNSLALSEDDSRKFIRSLEDEMKGKYE